MGMSTKSGGGAIAEINVTPFIDVMLVLLIIFMVTAPMMTQGLDVDLPQTRQVDALPTDADHMILMVDKEGRMKLDEYTINFDSMQVQIMENVVKKKKQLFLKADKDVPYGTVVRIMGEARMAGVEKLGVVADKVEDKSLVKPEPAPQGTKPGEKRR